MSQDYEAEQNLLGMAMLDSNCAIKLLEIPEAWFLFNGHKVMYREISTLVTNNLSVDSTALGDNILGTSEQKHGLDMNYFITLEMDATSTRHFDSYKTALFKIYKRQSIQSVADSLNKQLQAGDDVVGIITTLQDKVFELLTDHNESKPESMHHYMKQVVDDLKWQHDNPGVMLGKQSGYKELDELINGF